MDRVKPPQQFSYVMIKNLDDSVSEEDICQAVDERLANIQSYHSVIMAKEGNYIQPLT